MKEMTNDILYSLGSTGLATTRLGLGTVEIGLPYGIGSPTLPSDSEAESILKKAVEMGVTYIDTARGYGVAEERIGKFGISTTKGVTVGTKCGQFLERGEDPRGTELEQRIREEVDESRRLLNLDMLPLLQIHGGSKEQIERGELIEIMQKLKDEEKVSHVGIATRGVDAPLAAITSSFFETIQTAYSILDQRMAGTVFPEALQHNVGIINRSVFLKGVLTPKRANLPAVLSPLANNADRAEKIAHDIGIDLPTLAIRFALSNPAVSIVLIGTTKTSRIEQAFNAYNEGPLLNDILEKLTGLAIEDEHLIDPSRWPH